jgi:NitT/TauT family transport system permease protein
MAAELIVNSGGLGFLLERDRDNGDMEGVIATIIIIIVIGLAVQELVFAPLQNASALCGVLPACAHKNNIIQGERQDL